jgi:hypothetical protein
VDEHEAARRLALLMFLYNAKRAALPNHSGAVILRAALGQMGLGLQDARHLAVSLKREGLVELPNQDSIGISSQGEAMVEEHLRLTGRGAAPVAWIHYELWKGLSLRDRPTLSDDIRAALAELAEIKAQTAGPGAQRYEQARALEELLRSDLEIALARESARHAIVVQGGIHRSTVQQGTGNVFHDIGRPAAPNEGWPMKLIIGALAAVVAGLILFYGFGIP